MKVTAYSNDKSATDNSFHGAFLLVREFIRIFVSQTENIQQINILIK